MLTVIDLGCYTHPTNPEDESTHKLIDRYHPDFYFGFDPHPNMRDDVTIINKTTVLISRMAAWTYDGTVHFDMSPNRPLAARIGSGDIVVPCFNFAKWYDQNIGHGGILKMDIEGAEYPLLDHIRESHLDYKLQTLLVEWHEPPIGPPNATSWKELLLSRLRCLVEDW